MEFTRCARCLTRIAPSAWRSARAAAREPEVGAPALNWVAPRSACSLSDSASGICFALARRSRRQVRRSPKARSPTEHTRRSPVSACGQISTCVLSAASVEARADWRRGSTRIAVILRTKDTRDGAALVVKAMAGRRAALASWIRWKAAATRAPRRLRRSALQERRWQPELRRGLAAAAPAPLQPPVPAEQDPSARIACSRPLELTQDIAIGADAGARANTSS